MDFNLRKIYTVSARIRFWNKFSFRTFVKKNIFSAATLLTERRKYNTLLIQLEFNFF